MYIYPSTYEIESLAKVFDLQLYRQMAPIIREARTVLHGNQHTRETLPLRGRYPVAIYTPFVKVV